MESSRIMGITVEIGGDTTKLQTALKGVNTEIRGVCNLFPIRRIDKRRNGKVAVLYGNPFYHL